jgi:hypothetical protein
MVDGSALQITKLIEGPMDDIAEGVNNVSLGA